MGGPDDYIIKNCIRGVYPYLNSKFVGLTHRKAGESFLFRLWKLKEVLPALARILTKNIISATVMIL